MDEESILNHLMAQLVLEEGKKSYLYDDATGMRIIQGTRILGNITAAVGVNLSDGLDSDEVLWLSTHRMKKTLDWLAQFSWCATLDPVRAAAVADIVFNLGQTAPSKWPSFFHYVAVKDWNNAAQQISSNTLWISQVKETRATRVESMIKTGSWPADVTV